MNAKHKRNGRLLLQVATITPGFDGDFVNLAALLGWTSGRLWRHNPAIKFATIAWRRAQRLPPLSWRPLSHDHDDGGRCLDRPFRGHANGN